MEILGHRGRPTDHTPENTLASVQAALADGAHGVEVDVRLTADGVAVCCHDAGLDRTAGVARGIRSLTAAELTAIRVQGHPVPTVADVLRAMPADRRLVLDLKPEQRPRALLTAVAEAVAAAVAEARGPLPSLVLSSFDPNVLAAAAALAPSLERAAILPEAAPPSHALSLALARGESALHLPARTVFAVPDLVAAAHRRGIAVRVWTVNRLVDARLLRLLDVDAVLSDVPGELLRGLELPALGRRPARLAD